MNYSRKHTICPSPSHLNNLLLLPSLFCNDEYLEHTTSMLVKDVIRGSEIGNETIQPKLWKTELITFKAFAITNLWINFDNEWIWIWFSNQTNVIINKKSWLFWWALLIFTNQGLFRCYQWIWSRLREIVRKNWGVIRVSSFQYYIWQKNDDNNWSDNKKRRQK